MGAAVERDFLGHVGDIEDGALHAPADHECAAPLNADEDALGLQFTQGASHRQPGRPELLRKLDLRRNLVFSGPLLRLDTAIDRRFYLLIEVLIGFGHAWPW